MAASLTSYSCPTLRDPIKMSFDIGITVYPVIILLKCLISIFGNTFNELDVVFYF